MRIAVDLTPTYDHLTGIERYNICIVKEMIKHHPEDVFILVFKGEVYSEFEELVKKDNISHIILQPCNKLLFIQFRLMKAMSRIDADYYLFLSFTSPVLFRKEKTISAIHDLTCWDCPESIPTKMKYYYRWTYKAAIKTNWKIITVSKFSQRRICERYELQVNQIPVVYDGLSEIFQNEYEKDPNAIFSKYQIPSDYILSLSTIEPRKNLQLLISVYQELMMSDENIPDLVLAGRKGWKLDEILSSLEPDIQNRIHFTGFVDNEDLPGLYKSARIFVFPSKYEGFGLPIIEAMSQGVIVLSSDAASLPEITGNGGVLFRSEDRDDLKQKLLYCLSMPMNEKQRLIEEATKIAHSFSWDNEAEKLHEIMRIGLNGETQYV